MKFGRRLQEEAVDEFKSHYIAYKELKKAIKLITGNDTSNVTIAGVTSNFGNIAAFSGSPSRPPEARFQELLNFEVEKINNFASLIFSSVVSAFQSVLKRLQNGDKMTDISNVGIEADEAASTAIKLHSYVRLNFVGFRKITKKFDKHNRSTASFWYLARLAKERFVNLNFDYLVELVSVCFAEIRRLRQSETQKLSTSNSASSVQDKPHLESRSTTYLITDEEVMRVRIYLAKHLFVTNLGRIDCPSLCSKLTRELAVGIPSRHRSTVPTADRKESLNASDEAVPSSVVVLEEKTGRFINDSIYKFEANRISRSCVYYDEPQVLPKYRQALNSDTENTPVLRVRARGVCLPMEEVQNDVSIEVVDTFSSPQTLVEKNLKISADHPVLCPNAVAMSYEDASEFLQQKLTIPAYVTKVKLSSQQVDTAQQNLEAVASELRGGAEPLCAVFSHRTSFFIDEHDTNGLPAPIHASLDEGVTFANWEPNTSLIALMQSPRQLNPEAHLSQFGVLSLSLPMNVPQPAFLPRLSGMTSVVETYRYSLFLHGVALRFQETLGHLELPQWFKFVSVPNIDEGKPRKLSKPLIVEEEPTDSQMMRVDIMSNRPRERLLHEHVINTQQEERRGASHDEAGAIRFPSRASVSTRAASPKRSLGEVVSTTTWKKKTSPDQPLTEPLLNTTGGGLSIPQISSARYPFGGADASRDLESNDLSVQRRHVSSWVFGGFSLPKWLLNRRDDKERAPYAMATVRVEPKTFFANERTLLQWMNTAVLLSTISITLLNFGTHTGRVAGLILAPVALFFIIYSFLVYLKRSYSLERKEPINYNDRLGPAILVFCLIGALAAVIGLNIITGENELTSSAPEHPVVAAKAAAVKAAAAEFLVRKTTEG